MRDRAETLHALIRTKRRAAGLSQFEAGQLIGCTQSAVSLLESGQYTAISTEKIAALCEHLGVAPEDMPQSARNAAASLALKYCPTATCPMNVLYLVDGRLVVRPRMLRSNPVRTTHCPLCGATLLSACPNPHCGAPPCEGAAFCLECGEPLVEVPAKLYTTGPPEDMLTRHETNAARAAAAGALALAEYHHVRSRPAAGTSPQTGITEHEGDVSNEKTGSR